MKEIRLIAIDLDGTLVNHNQNEISKENINALELARQNGVRVVINTGRPPEYCWELTEKIKYKGELITNCGSRIFEMPQRKTIHKNVISVDSCYKFIEFTEKNNIISLICAIDKAYILKDGLKKIRAFEGHSHQSSIFNNVVENYDGLLKEYPDDIDKLEAYATKELLDKTQAWIDKEMPDIMYARTSDEVLEIYSADAGKGNGLKKLADSLKIPSENVMAIGDSGNDLHMFNYAGISVAMGNSPKDIASQCDYVTSDVLEHGVAKAIETFILNQKKKPTA